MFNDGKQGAIHNYSKSLTAQVELNFPKLTPPARIGLGSNFPNRLFLAGWVQRRDVFFMEYRCGDFSCILANELNDVNSTSG